MAAPATHSRCAWCDRDSLFTVGPATTWQSRDRPSKDVCDAHLIQAVYTLLGDGAAMVQVGTVRQYFYGTTGHTATSGP